MVSVHDEMGLYGADEAALSFREETTKRKRKAKMCPKEKENKGGDPSFADESPVEQRGKHSGFVRKHRTSTNVGVLPNNKCDHKVHLL